MKNYLIPLFLVICLITPCMTEAKEKASSDGEAIKALFQKKIDQQKQNIESAGGQFDVAGDIIVEPAEDYYAVTLPEINLTLADQRKTKIGLTPINVAPADKPQQWKMSISAPNPILFKDQNDTEQTSISFKEQRMAGIWDDHNDNFTKFVARYGGVQVQDKKSNTDFLFKTIGVSNEYEKSENDLTNFKTKIEMLGIQNSNMITDSFEADTQPKDIIIDMNADNFPLAQFQKSFNALMGNSQNDMAKRLAVLQTFIDLPNVLAKAQTDIKIDRIAFRNDLYAFEMDADLKANGLSPIGLSGVININCKNLEDLINRLETHQDTVDKDTSKEIEKLINKIKIFRLLSTREDTIDTYKIVIDQDGKTHINEKDASILLSSIL